MNITQQELSRRNALLKDSKEEARDQAAVIYMVNWMKRKGVPQDKLTELGVWSPGELDHIAKIYKYSY